MGADGMALKLSALTVIGNVGVLTDQHRDLSAKPLFLFRINREIFGAVFKGLIAIRAGFEEKMAGRRSYFLRTRRIFPKGGGFRGDVSKGGDLLFR